MDLTRRKTNPVHCAIDQFSSMFFEPMSTGPLATLFWYFAGDNAYSNDVVDQVRSLISELCLQTEWRFAKYDSEPYSLVVFGDATRSYQEKLEKAIAYLFIFRMLHGARHGD